MFYLVKDVMASKLVLVGQYKTKEKALERKELEEANRYSFEWFSVCTQKEYEELLMLYV